MIRRKIIIVGLLSFALLQACTSTGVAPVSNRDTVKKQAPVVTERTKPVQQKKSSPAKSAIKSGEHTVISGDTLYSIAWRYNFDYKDVANWNDIEKPYTIYPGQIIRLKPVLKKKGTPLKSDKSVAKKTPPKPSTTTTTTTTVKPVKKKTTVVKKNTTSKPPLAKGPIKWSWPTNGKIVKSNSPTSKKGIDISGSRGQVIKAAAEGDVVYSGSGLLGYGRLIIIKHNETYLSAYAYNSELYVKEGDRVKAGQKISVMGQDNSGRNLLHFEIRKNGKPVDPIQHLPKSRA